MINTYLDKLREILPEPIRQFGGLVSLTFVVILSFAILNIFFGQGEELVEKMKKEEARIAEEQHRLNFITMRNTDRNEFPRLRRVVRHYPNQQQR